MYEAKKSSIKVGKDEGDSTSVENGKKVST